METQITVAAHDVIDAISLASFVTAQVEAVRGDIRPVVYVYDHKGDPITVAEFVRETLSDGSHVYNLTLSVDA